MVALEETGCTASVDPSRNVVLFNEQENTDARDIARAVTCAIRLSRNTSRLGTWKGLTLAGKVLHSDCDLDSSFAWLQAGKLSSTAVRNILAAQEGCLLTRASPGNRDPESSCRCCTNEWDTQKHVLTCCPRWLPTLYVHRHDSLGVSTIDYATGQDLTLHT